MKLDDIAMTQTIIDKNTEKNKALKPISDEQYKRQQEEKYYKFHSLELSDRKTTEVDCEHVIILELIQLFLVAFIFVFSWFIGTGEYGQWFGMSKVGNAVGMFTTVFFVYFIFNKKNVIFKPLNEIRTIRDNKRMKSIIRRENLTLLVYIINLFIIKLINMYILYI